MGDCYYIVSIYSWLSPDWWMLVIWKQESLKIFTIDILTINAIKILNCISIWIYGFERVLKRFCNIEFETKNWIVMYVSKCNWLILSIVESQTKHPTVINQTRTCDFQTKPNKHGVFHVQAGRLKSSKQLQRATAPQLTHPCVSNIHMTIYTVAG